MATRPGLRRRVAFGIAILSILIVSAHSVAIYVITEDREETQIDEVLAEEMESLLARYRADPNTPPLRSNRLSSYIARDAVEHANVPAYLRDLPLGMQDTVVDGREYHIDDGVDALLRILANRDGAADGRIFNIGNPKNDVSVRELAERLIAAVRRYPKYAQLADRVRLVTVSSGEYYGKGYQDILTRVPSIRNAEKYLDWRPTTDLDSALRRTLDYYLVQPIQDIAV
jgi:nucleoside-diphosphate-sugar epimerase